MRYGIYPSGYFYILKPALERDRLKRFYYYFFTIPSLSSEKGDNNN